ncbi:MAG: glycosyltransferase family 4 protein [Actinomycetota bacterium]
MRIAMVSPPWIEVPPRGYGGIEWVVSLLTEELVRRGHEVTLFATGDSVTSADLEYFYAEGQTSRMHHTAPDSIHARLVVDALGKAVGEGRPFDIVHDNTQALLVAFAPWLPCPTLHTLHGAAHPEALEFYGRFANTTNFNAISASQASDFPGLSVCGVVPNPIDVASFPFRADKQDYLLFLGRLFPDKGLHHALEVARRVGMPIKIAGKIDPGESADYFEAEIAPHLDGESAEYLGQVSDEEKKALLAGARATLFPIQWEEPFGLVMTESMACGTPVLAFRRGSVPEVVEDGVSGFIVDGSVEKMAEAVGRVSSLDPAEIRASAERRFSPGVVALAYERLYTRIVRGDRG